MMFARRPSLAATVATAALSLGLVAGTAGTAHAAYDPNHPPYSADPNRATGLTVYDAATGAAVTSGSTDTTLDHYYFVASTDFAPNHTKAAVSGFLAEAGKAPGAWSGEALGPATTYPVSGAPAPVSSATTETAKGDSQLTFGALAGSYPNNAASTSDYYQLYQVRIHTTFPTPQSDSYASADLQIDPVAKTWKVAVAQTPTDVKPTISLATDKINVGQSATMSLHGTPGDTVTLYNETAPATTFKIQTTHTLDPYGNWVASVSPRVNTKYYASTAAGDSATVQVSVRPALALRGRVSGRTVAFTGQVVPGHVLTIRLFQVSKGRLTLLATVRTNASGAWSYTRRFASAGPVQFISQSVSDSTSLAGQSNRLSVTLT